MIKQMKKQMKKRLLTIGLMLVIAISMYGCSSSEADLQITDKIDNSTVMVDNESSKSDIGLESAEPTGTTEKPEDTETSDDTSECETTAGQGGTNEAETSTMPSGTGEQDTTKKKPEQTTDKVTEETTTWNVIAIPEQTVPEPTISEEEKLAKEIIERIITDDMSEFEKAITIHDWLAYNVEYAYEALGNDELVSKYNRIDVTLTEGKAVCGGYAKTYELMCNLAGMEVKYVTSNACNHGWNQVKIGGKWYHVDVTNDAVKREEGDNFVIYRYFLFSDKNASSLLHIMDEGPYEVCATDYDINEIMQYSIENTIVKNVYYCETEKEATEKISSAVEAGINGCTLWLNIENLEEGNMPIVFETVRDEIMLKYGVLIEERRYEKQSDSIWTYSIEIYDIDNIPVATTYKELIDTYNNLYDTYGRYKWKYYIMYLGDEFPMEILEATEFDDFIVLWDKNTSGVVITDKYKDEEIAILFEFIKY